MQGLPQVAQATSNLSATQPYLAVDVDADEGGEGGLHRGRRSRSIVAAQTQPTAIGSITVGDDSSPSTCRTQDPPTTLDELPR